MDKKNCIMPNYPRKLYLIISIVLFVFTFYIYTLHDNSFPTTDSIPNNIGTVNIIYNQSLNFNNIIDVIDKRGLIGITSKNSNGGYFSKTPVINSILAIPFFYLSDKINNINSFNVELLFNDYYQIIGKYYASFLTAISVSLLFFVVYKMYSNLIIAITSTIIYAFCTFAYGTVSQANWEHAPSFLLFILSYIFIFKYLQNQKYVYLIISASLIFISYLVRPLNLVFIISLVLTLFLNKKYKKSLLVIAIFFIEYFLYSLLAKVIGIPDGYKNEIIGSLTNININYSLKVLMDLLISPNYGLLIFYPVTIFSFIGMVIFLFRYKKEGTNSKNKFLLTYTFLIVGAIFFLNSIWWAWPGGYSYGPRLLAEATIPLIFFLSYFFIRIKKNIPLIICIITLSFLSLFSNILCIYANNTEWNTYYMKGPSNYLFSAWSKPYFIPFYLFEKRSLYTKVIKVNSNGQKYLEQKTWLIEYKNKRLVKVFDTNRTLYIENQTSL